MLCSTNILGAFPQKYQSLYLKKERDNTKDQTHVDFCYLILQLLIHAMYI